MSRRQHGLRRAAGWASAARAARRAQRYWALIREGEDPRWQGNLIFPLMEWVARRSALPLRDLLLLEWISRRALGQPLTLRAWDRMTFSDKVVWRRLRGGDPRLSIFSDKLRMRRYVAQRLGEQSLPRLLAVADDPSQLADRRGPYVLKPNHCSGLVTFVADGDVLSVDQHAQARSWLAMDYARVELERGYAGARRVLLAEEWLRAPDGSSPPPDYKLLSFSGEVRVINVHTGRFGDHRTMLVRPDWTLIGARWRYPAPDDPAGLRPPNLALMLEWATRLSRGTGFLRVDLYDLGDRVVVGELTPYPAAGRERLEPASVDAWLGRLWHNPD